MTRRFGYFCAGGKSNKQKAGAGSTKNRLLYRIATSAPLPRNDGAQVIISELAWREFWHHIAHYFPETIDIEFQEKRR